jgi:uncharacterized protein YegJ (DUF2314 family)
MFGASGCTSVLRAINRAGDSAASTIENARSSAAASDDDVMTVESSDDAINAAIERARSTFDTFTRELTNADADPGMFAVKIEFKTDSGAPFESEHIWLNDVSVDGDTISGTIGNVPDYVSALKEGEAATASVKDLSDWYFIKDGKMHGGYTIRVFRDRMTQEEREAFDKDFPYEFAD